jgi:hypothetical protein
MSYCFTISAVKGGKVEQAPDPEDGKAATVCAKLWPDRDCYWMLAEDLVGGVRR